MSNKPLDRDKMYFNLNDPTPDIIKAIMELKQSIGEGSTGSTNLDYRGVNVFGRWRPSVFRGARATQMIDIAKEANMNIMVLCTSNPMTTYTSTTFEGQEQPDADIRDFCNQARSKGLMVALKPHVEVRDGTWRGRIAPTNVATWFSNYKTWMVQQATLAQSVGAEFFCLGCEMISMSIGDYRSYWEDLISAVRAVFSGKLTYAANGDGSRYDNEIFTCCFIDLLDFAGIDFYGRMTDKNDPTVNEMIDAWYLNSQGVNWVQTLEKWQLSHGKPVVFTEIGMARVDGANKAPGTTFSGTEDNQEQADYITAMFHVLRKRNAWVKGLWWWDITTETTDSYSFEHEPSFSAMKNGFAADYKGVNE